MGFNPSFLRFLTVLDRPVLPLTVPFVAFPVVPEVAETGDDGWASAGRQGSGVSLVVCCCPSCSDPFMAVHVYRPLLL